MSRILMRYSLWKTVNNFSGLRVDGLAARRSSPPARAADSSDSRLPLHACSACAGDYEDPDRTAWTPDEEEGDEGSQDEAQDRRPERAGSAGVIDDEFPADEV